MLDKHLIAYTRPCARKENVVLFGDIRITVLSDRLFRVEKDEKHLFCDEATQIVWYRDIGAVDYREKRTDSKGEECVEDFDGESVTIETSKVSLTVCKSLENSYVTIDNNKIAINNKENLLGTYRTLDGCNGNLCVPYDGDMSRSFEIQLENGVVSKNGVAVLDDKKSLILSADGIIKERRPEQEDFYIFAFGHDYRAAVKALYSITGYTPLIPRYALGNWWSRYHAYTQKEYTHLMEQFDEQEIPFTVATVDMDWHWSTTLDRDKKITENGKNDELHGGTDGWTGYSWNTNLFPDYVLFLKRLHELNLRVTLNLHPALGVRYFEDCYKEMAEEMNIDPNTEKTIKFDITDDNFINAYFKVLHKPYERKGVDFWWIDWQQGNNSGLKGLDPLWSLNHYHFLDNAKEHSPLILSRYCGIGSHRYPLGFSGDTHVTWKTIKYLPYFTATASNAGYTWWSHDIGGHMWGIKDDELYVRFVQFGVFSPINRLHCSNNETFTKEPLAYKNGTGKIIEEFLKLRHRMIPYLYSASYENYKNGRALIEPMYYEYPDKEEAYKCADQYMFGGQLLVAPVVSKAEEYGMSVTDVWVPSGIWTDIFTGDTYEGGKNVKMVRYMDSIPVLAKEGGVFVLDGRKHGNATDNPKKLTAWIYNGCGEYTLHEEYGGAFVHTSFKTKMNMENVKDEDEFFTQKLQISVSEEKSGIFEKRDIELVFQNICSGEVSVKTDGISTEVKTDDNKAQRVYLKDVEAGHVYDIEICAVCNKKKALFDKIKKELMYFQMDNNDKENIYRSLLNEGENVIKKIDGAGIPQIFKKRLMEVIE